MYLLKSQQKSTNEPLCQFHQYEEQICLLDANTANYVEMTTHKTVIGVLMVFIYFNIKINKHNQTTVVVTSRAVAPTPG